MVFLFQKMRSPVLFWHISVPNHVYVQLSVVVLNVLPGLDYIQPVI